MNLTLKAGRGFGECGLRQSQRLSVDELRQADAHSQRDHDAVEVENVAGQRAEDRKQENAGTNPDEVLPGLPLGLGRQISVHHVEIADQILQEKRLVDHGEMLRREEAI